AGEETKAIPIITDDQFQQNSNQDTIIHQTDGKTNEFGNDKPDKKAAKKSKKKKKNKRKKKWKKVILIILILLVLAIGTFFVLTTLMQPKDVTVLDLTE